RPRKKQSGLNLDDVDVDVKGIVRGGGVGGSKRGACRSQQGSKVAGGSKGGACRSKQDSVVAGRSKRGAGGSKQQLHVGQKEV
ncbi:hypothetical protein Tco_0376443, partial [Tanacetum coccineum]